MIKSSTEVQRLTIFHHIKDKISAHLHPIYALKQAAKNTTTPILRHKREKAKQKAMFSNNLQKDMADLQQIDNKNHQPYINKSSNQDEQQRNAYLLQAIKNQNYLKKKKNTQKEIRNDGFSIFNPTKSNWVPEQKEQDESGLDKFTNIVIKKLQRKCKKVSFSQFLQEKRQQDYIKKFKYTPQKRRLTADKSKEQNFPNIEKIKLNSMLSRNNNLPDSQSSLNKHSKSVMLIQSRKKSVKSRVYTKIAHERYHSISGLNEGFGGNTSLQISQIKAKQ